MGHPAIENTTPFALDMLFVSDEEGRPLLVTLVQATYAIDRGRSLVLAEQQPAPSLTGELWDPKARISSYRIEPAYAFIKRATDVVLVGHAQDPVRPVSELQVSFRVGPVGKVLRVVGDRFWVHHAGTIVAGRPMPFTRIPLSYERAFGGWDRSHPDPAHHAFEPRNPVGIGFRSQGSQFEEGVPLPNIEDPASPIQRWGQGVAPAGVGFVSPDWQPRAALGGTYDEAWTRDRMPLLPRDFDRGFFNAASAGLVAPGYLAGDEAVLVENASPHGRLSFRLPRARVPSCRIELAHGDAAPELRLDTVVVDADEDRVHLLYRAHVVLRDGPHDVRTVALEERVAPVRSPVPWRPGAAV